jgi:hypothetical protein
MRRWGFESAISVLAFWMRGKTWIPFLLEKEVLYSSTAWRSLCVSPPCSDEKSNVYQIVNRILSPGHAYSGFHW